MSERMNNEVVRETLLNIKYARFCLRRVGTRYVFYHSLVVSCLAPLSSDHYIPLDEIVTSMVQQKLIYVIQIDVV
jgi:hypothetical protein